MYVELDTRLTPEQAAIKQEAHRFAAEVLRPASIQLDRLADPQAVIDKGSPLWDVLRKTYELGYHIRNIPKELGGAGLSPLETHIVTEELAWGSVDLAVSIACVGAPFGILGSFGNGLREEYLVPFVNDREAKYVGCWAITEPLHGSDSLTAGEQGEDPWANYACRAEADGDEWVITGQKSAWVSNGTIATHALLFLAANGPTGRGGGVAFVPLDLPGVSKGKPLNKHGQRALNQGEIFFDDVRIPKGYMLVEPPMYQYMLNFVLGGANGGMAVFGLGVARAAFEEALSYAKGRVQGGRVICEHQIIQKKLFDMFMKVESARAYSRAAMLFNAANPIAGMPYTMASKVYCTNVAFEVASEAVQIHGGMGLSKEMLVEKLLRDARATLIEDGANDTLGLMAARSLLAQG